MLYNTVLVSDITHFCIERWTFSVLIFADHTKILVYRGQVLRFVMIWKGRSFMFFLVKLLRYL